MSEPSAAAAGHAPYVLGSDDAEIARLAQQAEAIAQPTLVLLRAAGIGPGMRVLDLGTGLGHVSLLLADLVGPTGEVVAIDRDARMLEHAEGRRAAAGVTNIRYLEGDARTFRDPEPFDAVAERLVLFHLADAVGVVRHHVPALRPGGLFVAVDYDIGACRAEPPVALVEILTHRVLAAFRAAHADPTIGARLVPLLAEAGLAGVQGFGVQAYIQSGDPRGAAMLAGVVRSLAPRMAASGIATAEELDLPTLEARLDAAIRAAGATIVLPTVGGAFGRRAAA
jgi:SAM-dependent methyltransferase